MCGLHSYDYSEKYSHGCSDPSRLRPDFLRQQFPHLPSQHSFQHFIPPRVVKCLCQSHFWCQMMHLDGWKEKAHSYTLESDYVPCFIGKGNIILLEVRWPHMTAADTGNLSTAFPNPVVWWHWFLPGSGKTHHLLNHNPFICYHTGKNLSISFWVRECLQVLDSHLCFFVIESSQCSSVSVSFSAIWKSTVSFTFSVGILRFYCWYYWRYLSKVRILNLCVLKSFFLICQWLFWKWILLAYKLYKIKCTRWLLINVYSYINHHHNYYMKHFF